MSLDLVVPITQPINVLELSSTSAVTLQRLLRQPNLLPVKVEEIADGSRTLLSEGVLIPERLYLLSVDNVEDSDVELIVMHGAFDMSEICPEATEILCLSIRGAAKAQIKAPFAAAVAIAIASLQRTIICDDAQNWTDCISITADALFNRMSVQRESCELQSAAADSCRRMNRKMS